jgi:tyrosine decarboxylase / aspartate 1-decarboxylase
VFRTIDPSSAASGRQRSRRLSPEPKPGLLGGRGLRRQLPGGPGLAQVPAVSEPPPFWPEELQALELPGFEGDAMDPADAAALGRTLEALQGEIPFPSPLYAGQMLKPPHRVARWAYALAQALNPNNHALDGGRVSSRMEKESVVELAGALGLPGALGHLTSGGTLANLEALWVSARLRPGTAVLASERAHYTHRRMASVLGLGFESVPTDGRGRMDPERLEAQLAAMDGRVACVVATPGTTGLGAVDPVADIHAVCRDHGVRLHLDAAYGGFFRLARRDLSDPARRAFDAFGSADSLVVDPHKHGLQPYGCGCVLFKDPAVGRMYEHDSPYTYFTSDDLHLGEISLECSRAGAAAVALWATLQRFPLTDGGEFAAGLGSCLEAARTLHRHLGANGWRVLAAPDLDIVVWAPGGATASEVSRNSRAVFDAAARRGLHLALIRLRPEQVRRWWPDLSFDEPVVTALRSVLMKWSHRDRLDAIIERLEAARSEVDGGGQT